MIPILDRVRRREVAPPSHQRRAHREEDAFAILEHRYTEWIGLLETVESDFKRFVYENPNAGETDFRQHRHLLYALLAIGEEVAVDFLMLEGVGEDRTRPYVVLADQKLDALRAVLNAWHGPMAAQADLPESFKNSIRDMTEGRVVSMEEALRNAPKVG